MAKGPAGGEHVQRGAGLHRWGAVVVMSLGLTLVTGCTRTYYRDFADRDTYGILRQRLLDWRWRVPTRIVDADPRSRMADFANPNYEPIPPDEPAATSFRSRAGSPSSTTAGRNAEPPRSNTSTGSRISPSNRTARCS